MTQLERVKTDVGRKYRTPDGTFPSVTNVLDMLPKPELEAWKRNTPNADEIRDRSAAVGSISHRRILNPLSIRRLEHDPIDTRFLGDDFTADVETCCALWDSIADEVDVSDSARIEHKLWASVGDTGYAGTADILEDGRVIDLKTSKSIDPDERPAYPMQLAAYAHAARQRGIADPDHGLVVKLDYRGMSSRILRVDDLESRFDRFRELLDEWHRTHG